MEIRRCTAEKQVMEEKEGGRERKEGRKMRTVVGRGWIMRTLMRGKESPE